MIPFLKVTLLTNALSLSLSLSLKANEEKKETIGQGKKQKEKGRKKNISSSSSGGVLPPPRLLLRHFLLDELLVPFDVELALAAVVVHKADLAEDGALGPAVVVGAGREKERKRERESFFFFFSKFRQTTSRHSVLEEEKETEKISLTPCHASRRCSTCSPRIPKGRGRRARSGR